MIINNQQSHSVLFSGRVKSKLNIADKIPEEDKLVANLCAVVVALVSRVLIMASVRTLLL